MLVTLGDTVHDLSRRPLIVGVVPAAADDQQLVLLAKAAISAGADVVDVRGDIATHSLTALNDAALLWGASAGEPAHARDLVAARAALLWWTGIPALLAQVQAAADPVPVLGHLVPWQAVRSAPSGPWMVDLGDEEDVASIAAQVTVALELGACAIRTTAMQAARRAAYVVRAIEAAR